MASPDVAAATYAPQWRSRPIPDPGDYIKLSALISSDASHFLHQIHAEGVVDRAKICLATSGLTTVEELSITLIDDPLEYRLRAKSPPCGWALMTPARRDAIPPTPEQPGPATASPQVRSIVTLERQLLAVQNRLRAIEGEKKSLEAEASALAGEIRDTALEQEMESLPAVDGMTAYFAPAYYVAYKLDEDTGKKFTPEDVRAALRECGHDYLISEGYNGNQLRALVREIKIDHQQPLPEPLARVLDLETRHDVRFTPMGERKRRIAPRRGD